jgi:hypothetical protein
MKHQFQKKINLFEWVSKADKEIIQKISQLEGLPEFSGMNHEEILGSIEIHDFIRNSDDKPYLWNMIENALKHPEKDHVLVYGAYFPPTRPDEYYQDFFSDKNTTGEKNPSEKPFLEIFNDKLENLYQKYQTQICDKFAEHNAPCNVKFVGYREFLEPLQKAFTHHKFHDDKVAAKEFNESFLNVVNNLVFKHHDMGGPICLASFLAATEFALEGHDVFKTDYDAKENFNHEKAFTDLPKFSLFLNPILDCEFYKNTQDEIKKNFILDVVCQKSFYDWFYASHHGCMYLPSNFSRDYLIFLEYLLSNNERDIEHSYFDLIQFFAKNLDFNPEFKESFGMYEQGMNSLIYFANNFYQLSREERIKDFFEIYNKHEEIFFCDTFPQLGFGWRDVPLETPNNIFDQIDGYFLNL